MDSREPGQRPRREWASYFAKERTSTLEAVRPTLWNGAIDATSTFGGDQVAYQGTILEQYKVYLEMADRISARRALANTFFLTLNTAVFTTIGVVGGLHLHRSRWFLVFPLIAVLGQCALWFWLIRSYRQLNSAKYLVVGALEEKLPASPYWRAEWRALGEGHDPAVYWPLTHIEKWVPVLFAAAYVGAFIAAMA